MDSFAFNSGTITARRLRRLIPVYSEGMLQTALENGCQDVPAVMAFLARRDSAGRAAIVQGGRKAARMPASRVTVMQRSKEWA